MNSPNKLNAPRQLCELKQHETSHLFCKERTERTVTFNENSFE